MLPGLAIDGSLDSVSRFGVPVVRDSLPGLDLNVPAGHAYWLVMTCSTELTPGERLPDAALHRSSSARYVGSECSPVMSVTSHVPSGFLPIDMTRPACL